MKKKSLSLLLFLSLLVSSYFFIKCNSSELKESKLSVNNSDIVNKSDTLMSDVDINIPNTDNRQEQTYALIIGNEDYSTYQTDLSSEVNVAFAMNDAQVFKAYCQKTLGIPKEQIKLLINATYAQMSQGIAWINSLAKIEGGKANLFFYYAGHGMPDDETKTAYMLPVDVSGTNVQNGVALKKVYKDFTEYPSKKVTVILDACFSGGARNKALKSARGVKVKPTKESINGNMVVFASSYANESSSAFQEKQHGYFTYFLLKKLQESKGNVTYKEMSEYLEYNVQKETAIDGKIQTPHVYVSSAAADKWKSWNFR